MLADFVGDEQAFESKYYDQKPKPNLTEIDLLPLPAKALFKNFDAPHVASTIQEEDDFFQVEDPKSKFRKFICQNSELYLEVDRDRLCLHASSMDSLNDSIQRMEKLCGEKIFFLAKTLANTTTHQISNQTFKKEVTGWPDQKAVAKDVEPKSDSVRNEELKQKKLHNRTDLLSIQY